MGDHCQVLPRLDWFQVRSSGALPTGVLLGDVVPADTFLHCAVEVGNERNSQLLSGANERLAERVVLHLLGDVYRTDAAVILVIEALVGLSPSEERQHFVITPVLVAERRPGLIVGFLATNVDHRIDRGAAAQRAALWVPH